MNDKDTVFPQYRKLVNNKSFYKIIDERNFEEIQLVGRLKNKYFIEAKIYPEILKINDLLNLEDPNYALSTKEEWDLLSD